ncbi:hypothetical protein FRB94_002221 [Tulasnella sp. JGI-2019a]|nr:hypothetical protein FRB94_002221 [Tulasnella sp. JGI-2019a]
MARQPPNLGTGLPTDEEIEYYYPPMFTWETVKDQVDVEEIIVVHCRDLGNLKRHPTMQIRYDKWMEGIKAENGGSIVNYLVNVKLRWAPTETRPATPNSHANPTYTDAQGRTISATLGLPTPPPTRPFTPTDTAPPEYFTANISPRYFKILKNDWPYSVPLDVTHFVFWTRVPIIHPALVPPKIWTRIEQDGLWGFTGSDRLAVPKTIDGKDNEETTEMVKRAHHECAQFVLNNWPPEEFEVAWFVNPPRLQSIPGLAHGHVFARKK